MRIVKTMLAPSRDDAVRLTRSEKMSMVVLSVLNRLVDKGNTVVVIEHNLDIIRAADYLIDMGPEGGQRGGQLLFQGTPEELKQSGIGYTSQYL